MKQISSHNVKESNRKKCF